MTKHEITRRAMIAGTSAAVSSAALGVAVGPATNGAHIETLPDRIERLAHDLSEAMGQYHDGEWRITVARDDNVLLQPPAKGTAAKRAEIHLANYCRAMVEADPTITGWTNSYCIDTGKLSFIQPNYRA